MKRTRHLLFSFLAFLLVGELVVRFDQATCFFHGDRLTVLANVAHMTPLYQEVAGGSFTPAADEYRVMLVGDSYLHGNKMAPDERFAVGLERELQAIHPQRRVRVLDLTVPGANTYTNTCACAQYGEIFRPHALVWAYNIDDPYGCMTETVVADATAPAATQVQGSLTGALRWLHAAATGNSRLLGYVVPTVGRELEARGVVVPGTHSHHELCHSHDPSFSGWVHSRRLLAGALAECRERGVRVLVVNCPDLSLLGHDGVRRDVDTRLAEFFTAQGVDYLRGADLFAGGRSADFAVSRYDGHPNGRAHGVLARGVASRLGR